MRCCLLNSVPSTMFLFLVCFPFPLWSNSFFFLSSPFCVCPLTSPWPPPLQRRPVLIHTRMKPLCTLLSRNLRQRALSIVYRFSLDFDLVLFASPAGFLFGPPRSESHSLVLPVYTPKCLVCISHIVVPPGHDALNSTGSPTSFKRPLRGWDSSFPPEFFFLDS